MRLTKSAVEAAESASADRFYWDDRLSGFSVKVTPKGRRVQYRARGVGQSRRVTLGVHGAPWTTEKAREAAQQILLRAQTGEDPIETQRSERQASQQAKAAALALEQTRFGPVLELFISSYAKPKNRRWADAKRVIEFDTMPAWRDRPLTAITRRDIIALRDRVSARSPSSARALYAQLRRLFGWCVEQQLIDRSPCEGIRAPRKVASRDRYLSDSEIRLLWNSLENEGGPFEPVFKLLLLTSQRRDEVTAMKWSEVGFKKREWIIPKERCKNGVAHAVDLAPPALTILKALPRTSSLVFTTTGQTPLSNHAKARQRVSGCMETLQADRGNVRTPIPPWRLHDLRRTAATGMLARGTSPHVVEAVLNHRSGTRSGLVAVYQHYEYRRERRAAMLGWARYVRKLSRQSQPKS